MKRITSAKPLSGYRLDLTFDDGVAGIVDLSSLVGKGVFAAWKDPGTFESVQVRPSGEVAWGDTIDLCPNSLYLRVTGKSPEDVFPALRREHAHA